MPVRAQHAGRAGETDPGDVLAVKNYRLPDGKPQGPLERWDIFPAPLPPRQRSGYHEEGMDSQQPAIPTSGSPNLPLS